MVSKFKTQLLLSLLFCFYINSKAQTTANLIIDSVNVVFKNDVSFPYWLKAGQTIKPGNDVASISILEFKIDTSNQSLVFSQVINLRNQGVVPSLRTWKVEAVALYKSIIPSVAVSPAIFKNPGAFNWTVPPDVNRICVEVWGGGGSGFDDRGSGGGGYGYQCFNVSSGTTYQVIVGGPGPGGGYGLSGGTSSVGTLISATGGEDGLTTRNAKGGNSSATFNVSGGDSNGSRAGNGAFGGIGGGHDGNGCATPGESPGGGGGGSQNTYKVCGNFSGAPGRVIIHW
jgi:hypothetical protein